MDDGPGLGAKLSKRMDVGHHIVAELGFIFRRLFKINVLKMGLHLGDLFVGNLQAQLLLRFRQRHPKPAPGGKLILR